MTKGGALVTKLIVLQHQSIADEHQGTGGAGDLQTVLDADIKISEADNRPVQNCGRGGNAFAYAGSQGLAAAECL